MKKNICLILIILSSLNLSLAQEWMTSLKVAKRLALVQDKMIFAMWEESTYYPFPVQLDDNKGNLIITDLFEDDAINKILWEYFVPVKISEYEYEDLFNPIKDKRSSNYISKFNDDSIKILDANGNIFNVHDQNVSVLNLSEFINKYAINITFLKGNLTMYDERKNFTSSLRLAMKLFDFAIFNRKSIKNEIIDLANIYLNEAQELLLQSDEIKKESFSQMCDLNRLKSHLILNKPKKLLRVLKKIDAADIDSSNVALYSFLNYTANKLLKKEKNSEIWKNQISLVDLKKAQLIINSNK